MISDEERRKVARRLHELEKGVIGALIPTGELAEGILRAIDYGRSGAMTPYGCLADLIEPGEPKVRCVAEVKVDGEQLEQLVHDAAAELTGIDRDALLALADEIDRKSNDGTVNPDPMRPLATSLDLFGYARRIREALGVKP